IRVLSIHHYLEYAMEKIIVSILSMIDQRHPLGPKIAVLENMEAGKSLLDRRDSSERADKTEHRDSPKAFGVPDQQSQILYFSGAQIAVRAVRGQEPPV